MSLGEYSTVGSLMGKLIGGTLLIEGYFARMMYMSLYKMHLWRCTGSAKVALETPHSRKKKNFFFFFFFFFILALRTGRPKSVNKITQHSEQPLR